MTTTQAAIALHKYYRVEGTMKTENFTVLEPENQSTGEFVYRSEKSVDGF